MFTESTKFTYSNRSSEEFGITLGRTGGLPSYKTGLSTDIVYDKIKYVDKIYYYGTEKNIHEFEVEMYKETRWTVQDRFDIYEWLFQKDFSDFTFLNPCGNSDYTSDVVYNCKPIGEIEAVDFGGMYGIKIKFMNSLPYATTQFTQQPFNVINPNWNTIYGYEENYPTYPTLQYDQNMPYAEDVNQPQIIKIINSGNLNEHFYDITLKVELLNSSTGFSLKNLSDSGHIVSFSNLNVGETITMQNQLGIITSSTNLNRLSKWNKNYFRLVSGANNILVTGDCNILVEAKYPLIL